MTPPILRALLISAATFDRAGITTMKQYQCFLAIASKPGIDALTLGKILGCGTSAIHAFCGRLVENDLIFFKMGKKTGPQFKVRYAQFFLTKNGESKLNMEVAS